MEIFCIHGLKGLILLKVLLIVIHTSISDFQTKYNLYQNLSGIFFTEKEKSPKTYETYET